MESKLLASEIVEIDALIVGCRTALVPVIKFSEWWVFYGVALVLCST